MEDFFSEIRGSSLQGPSEQDPQNSEKGAFAGLGHVKLGDFGIARVLDATKVRGVAWGTGATPFCMRTF